MPSIRRILVAIRDPGARRSVALERAAQLAAACNASIELFHGIDIEIPIDLLRGSDDILGPLQTDARQGALHELERLARPYRRAGLKITTSAEWDFPLHEAVIRQALQTRADLIVAHQHGKHRFPALLHHTDWELLRSSPLPVLLVRRPRAYRSTAILAAIDPAHAFGKPAALDAVILQQAQTLATALRTSLHVVHALAPPQLSPNVTPRPARNRSLQDARKVLARALAHRKVSPARRHLLEGQPALIVPAVARRLRADVVVMGAVSRSGLQRLFIGNTAERIIDELKSDLLVVKPAGFGSDIPRRRRGIRLISAISQF
jgi:universal stress protein E